MDWAEYSRKRFEKCKKAEMPFHACFELTPFCNFRCNMCYIRLDPEQAHTQGNLLTTEQWLQIARDAKKMGTFTLEVTGGEPTTRSDFSVLYEAFIKMGYLIHLRTNGYLIQGKTLELLTKYKPRKISVTIYGASDETYERVCGISDGFSVVTKNVLAMRDAGINIHLTMTVTKDNEQDMEAVDRWAKDNGLAVIPYGALLTPIRAAKRSVEHLQVSLPEEEFEIPEELMKYKREVKDRPALMHPFWMCRGFGAKCTVSWDGHMTICNTFTPIWSDPIKEGFEKAYHALYSDLRKLHRPEECKTCEYIEFCAGCPSQIQSASGNSEQACERICKMARRKYKLYLQLKASGKDLKERYNDFLCDEGDELE